MNCWRGNMGSGPDMSYPPSIGENEKRLLEIIRRGHPNRRVTLKRRGRSIEVSALTWDELELAFGSQRSILAEYVAHLVASDYIDSERTYSSLWQAIKSGETPTY